jgi:hypothetical protein
MKLLKHGKDEKYMHLEHFDLDPKDKNHSEDLGVDGRTM